MIHNPFLLILILLSIEVAVLVLAQNPRTKHLFKFLPSMFWIYFIPMVLSTCGIIDPKSSIYAGITKLFLPPALFLLLLKIDLKAISKLGPVALVMFFTGSLGIILGMIISFILFKPWIGPQFWSGFGALAASWTGGSANMVAVKEALNVPDNVFMPMVIVDTVLPYTWIGILVALAARQKDYDTWNNADRRILDDLAKRVTEKQKASTLSKSTKRSNLSLFKTALIIGLAFLIGQIAGHLSTHLPEGKGVLTPYAWTIIIVTSLAIIFSLTSISRISNPGANKCGYWMLYFVLTSIGARASLNSASQAGILIIAGILVIIIHSGILLLVARLIRAPLFLVVTASLSNMAGLVSAPMVAELYQPGLASVGLLLAILGHTLGAYLGILTGQICHIFSS